MALFIDGRRLEEPRRTLEKLDLFLQKYQHHFEKSAEELKSSPRQIVSRKNATLYVNQREIAILRADSKISKLGSDMATTCHIIVLRCPATKVTAVGHFDGISTSQGVNDMIDGMVKEIMEQQSLPHIEVDLDLHIIGGFDDERNLSKELSQEILKEFNSCKQKQNVRIHLRTFCATSLNNVKINVSNGASSGREIDAPAVLGLIVDVKTGDICHASYQDDAKQPLANLRSARSLNGVKRMDNIYRPKENCFVMNPFTYDRMSNIGEWLEQPEHIIRKYMSTSPEVEPENFVEHIRQTLRFIEANPDPMESVFQGNSPLIFDPVFTEDGLVWKKRT